MSLEASDLFLRFLQSIFRMGVLAAIFWFIGLLCFIASIPRSVPTNNKPTDAIVVLTGGSDRLIEGLNLLNRGLAKKLFISGVHPFVSLNDLLKKSGIQVSQANCCVALGYIAGSTQGNAQETALWMKKENYRSLRLVTANYHMQRSLFEFRKAMPDIYIVSHPVQIKYIDLDHWWSEPKTARLLIREYNKFLLAQSRELIFSLPKVCLHSESYPKILEH